MNLEILENKIFYYKNIIEHPNLFIKNIENLDLSIGENFYLSRWTEWTASNNKNIVYGFKKEGSIFNKCIINEYDNQCLEILKYIKNISENCISDYVKKTKAEEIVLPNHFFINKYNTGEYMGPHVDSGDPTDKRHPYISGVLYLNNDYDGGELYFKNQEITIKPEAGSMVIFPSYEPYIHHAKVVLSGNKYISPFFWFKK